ncbi:hypothetical protein [Bremerella cremea]|uniref:hypothetical protein n=1 Tax=Bremerella cremea TaxID=1031537 RepID=UPI0031F05E06
MLKGCGLSLLILAALVGGYMFGFDQVFPRPEGLIFGGIAGLITFFCIGALSNAWQAHSDWSLISKAQFGLQLNGGSKVAVAGRLKAISEPITAPFSGKPCLICEYDLARGRGPTTSKHENTGSDYAGFLMTPCKIETPFGEVRLLGYPMLEEISDNVLITSDAVQNARTFLATTQFEDRSGMKIVSVLSVFTELWSDDDGSVTKNMRLTTIPDDKLIPADAESRLMSQAELETSDHNFDDDEDEDDYEQLTGGERLGHELPRLVEKLVEPGTQVVVFGIYDEARRGLMPPKGSMYANRLRPGTPEKVEGQLRTKMLANAIGALIVLALLHGGVYLAMQNTKQKADAEPAAKLEGNSYPTSEICSL